MGRKRKDPAIPSEESRRVKVRRYIASYGYICCRNDENEDLFHVSYDGIDVYIKVDYRVGELEWIHHEKDNVYGRSLRFDNDELNASEIVEMIRENVAYLHAAYMGRHDGK